MDYESILREQFNNVADPDALSSLSESAGELAPGLAEQFTAENVLNAAIEGKSLFSDPVVIDRIKDLALFEVKSALVLSVEIICICIITGILKNISSSFGSKSVAEISMMVCTMVIIGISVNSFRISYRLATDAVGTMADTMAIVSPVLIGIMLATGAAVSGTVLSPMITGSAAAAAFAVRKFILPALFAATVLSLVNCLTEKDYVNKLSRLLRNLSVAVTGVMLVVLTGIITVQGLLTDASDGLLINTAKYSLSAFIPIVGGFTSDTIELFMRCMASIKSVVGVFGIIILVAVMAAPIIKMLATAVIYKLTAALAEPVAESKISQGLNDMGSCMVSMAAITFFTSMLFVMFISVILKVGG